MNSYLTDDFLDYYRNLPASVREQARRSYGFWKRDPNHPSLRFKRVHRIEAIYSVRVGQGWRVLGLREADSIYWFWIGSHADYEKLLSGL